MGRNTCESMAQLPGRASPEIVRLSAQAGLCRLAAAQTGADRATPSDGYAPRPEDRPPCPPDPSTHSARPRPGKNVTY